MLNNILAYLSVAFTDITEREEGQGLVEYALIISVVSVAAIVSLGLLSDDIDAIFTSILP